MAVAKHNRWQRSEILSTITILVIAGFAALTFVSGRTDNTIEDATDVGVQGEKLDTIIRELESVKSKADEIDTRVRTIETKVAKIEGALEATDLSEINKTLLSILGTLAKE